tara:strand:- start:722 stop:1027 length:306 start_codon:yes stop_codon:yes gene_type:complete
MDYKDIVSRELDHSLVNYYNAPMSGPLNPTWSNRPHQIVSDLVAALLHKDIEILALRKVMDIGNQLIEIDTQLINRCNARIASLKDELANGNCEGCYEGGV